jgi:PAS domain S-box-containing protein
VRLYLYLYIIPLTPLTLSRLDGKFVRCNSEFCKLTGFSSDELMQRTVFSLTKPSEMHVMYNVVSSLLKDQANSPHKFWKQCLVKDGIVPCYVSIDVIHTDNGEPKYFHCIALPLPDFPETANQITLSECSFTALP